MASIQNSQSAHKMIKYFWFFLMLCPLLVSAQQVGLWAGMSVEKKLGKSFSLNVNGQARLTDQVSILKNYLGEAGVDYKLNKYFGAGVYYRYIGRRKHDKNTDAYYYRSFHRFYGNITFDYRLARWLKFDYRFRYQNQFKDDSEGLTNSGSYFRHKIEFTYKNKSRFAPYLSADAFYLIGTGFDQVSCKTGVAITLRKKHSLEVGVFKDVAIGTGLTNDPIVALNYKVRL